MPDTLTVLESEFDADTGSFLLQPRSELRRDTVAFTRMTGAIHEYALSREPESDKKEP